MTSQREIAKEMDKELLSEFFEPPVHPSLINTVAPLVSSFDPNFYILHADKQEGS